MNLRIRYEKMNIHLDLSIAWSFFYFLIANTQCNKRPLFTKEEYIEDLSFLYHLLLDNFKNHASIINFLFYQFMIMVKIYQH